MKDKLFTDSLSMGQTIHNEESSMQVFTKIFFNSQNTKEAIKQP